MVAFFDFSGELFRPCFTIFQNIFGFLRYFKTLETLDRRRILRTFCFPSRHDTFLSSTLFLCLPFWVFTQTAFSGLIPCLLVFERFQTQLPSIFLNYISAFERLFLITSPFYYTRILGVHSSQAKGHHLSFVSTFMELLIQLWNDCNWVALNARELLGNVASIRTFVITAFIFYKEPAQYLCKLDLPSSALESHRQYHRNFSLRLVFFRSFHMCSFAAALWSLSPLSMSSIMSLGKLERSVRAPTISRITRPVRACWYH